MLSAVQVLFSGNTRLEQGGGASEIERRAEAGGHQSILLWNLNLIHAIHSLANYDIDENDIY